MWIFFVVIIAVAWTSIGGKIAADLRKKFLGHWYWNNIHYQDGGRGWRWWVILTILDGPIWWGILGVIGLLELITWPFERLGQCLFKKVLKHL